MSGGTWEFTGGLLTVLTPLVAIPLTMITFYLRSLREHQLTAQQDAARRIDAVEAVNAECRKAISDIERDFTTKEEWLRECMHARRVLEQLTESTVRIETIICEMRPGEVGHAVPEPSTIAFPRAASPRRAGRIDADKDVH